MKVFTWLEKNLFPVVLTTLLGLVVTWIFQDKLLGMFKKNGAPGNDSKSTAIGAPGNVNMPVPPKADLPATGDRVIANGDVNVRSKPSTDGEVYYTAKSGAYIGTFNQAVPAQGGTSTGTWYEVFPYAIGVPSPDIAGGFVKRVYVYSSLVKAEKK